MPPFECRVEITPQEGMPDPKSAYKLRELHNSGVEGGDRVSELRVSKVVTFVVDCATKDEAIIQAQDLTERLLANPVFETANISVIELD